MVIMGDMGGTTSVDKYFSDDPPVHSDGMAARDMGRAGEGAAGRAGTDAGRRPRAFRAVGDDDRQDRVRRRDGLGDVRCAATTSPLNGPPAPPSRGSTAAAASSRCATCPTRATSPSCSTAWPRWSPNASRRATVDGDDQRGRATARRHRGARALRDGGPRLALNLSAGWPSAARRPSTTAPASAGCTPSTPRRR